MAADPWRSSSASPAPSPALTGPAILAAVAASTSQREFNLSDFEFGLSYSVYALPNIILPFFAGLFVNRVGNRPSTIIFVATYCIGAMIVALAPYAESYNLLLFGRFVFGIGSESANVSQNSYAVDWFYGKTLPFAMSVATSVGRLGTVLSFNLLGEIAVASGHYTTALWFVFVVCLSSLASAIALAVLDQRANRVCPSAKKRPEEPEMQVATADTSVHTDAVVAVPAKSQAYSFHFTSSFYMVTIFALFFYAAIFPFTAISSYFFHQKYHVSNIVSARLTSIVIIVALFLSPLIGLGIDRFKRVAPMCIAAASATLVPAFLMLGVTDISPVMPMIIIGCAFSFVPSILWPSVASLVPANRIGVGYGAIIAAQNLGLTIFNVLAGVVHDETGSYATLCVFFAGIGCIAFFFCVAWVIIDARCPEHRMHRIEQQEAREARERDAQRSRDEEENHVLVEKDVRV